MAVHNFAMDRDYARPTNSEQRWLDSMIIKMTLHDVGNMLILPKRRSIRKLLSQCESYDELLVLKLFNIERKSAENLRIELSSSFHRIYADCFEILTKFSGIGMFLTNMLE